MLTKSRLRRILKKYYGRCDGYSVKEIMSYLDENEIGVSDSQMQNGALPLVGERKASEADKSAIGESEHGTLENRIDSENNCPKCGDDNVYQYCATVLKCRNCNNGWFGEL